MVAGTMTLLPPCALLITSTQLSVAHADRIAGKRHPKPAIRPPAAIQLRTVNELI